MTATMTEAVACPKCGGRMWDNRLTKRNKKAPDYKCRDRSCDGVIWPPKNGKPGYAKPQGKQPYNAGPFVPGLDDAEEAADLHAHTQPTHAPVVDPAKAMLTLYRDCFAEALRMVKALNDDPKTVLEFTSDNVCSITSTLFIEANKRGVTRLAA